MEIEEGLWVRFPSRDASFDDGMEMGVLAAQLAMGIPQVVRAITPRGLDQAVELARHFGYWPVHSEPAGATVRVTFSTRRASRPMLRLVAANG